MSIRSELAGFTRNQVTNRSSLKSQIRFREGHSNLSVPAIDHLRVHAISEGPEWQGLHLEVGDGRGWQEDELMVSGHVVGINLGESSVRVETRIDGAFQPVILRPGSLWIYPEAHHFSTRHQSEMPWATVVIDGAYLDSVLGSHHELKMGFGIRDDLLSFTYRALISCLYENKRASLTESLVRSFMLALGSKHGVPAPELGSKGGGIAAHHLNSLFRWVENNLGAKFSVDVLAEHVGLSPAHFSREFKRSTGITPWEHVVELRLQRAMTLLQGGMPGHFVAIQVGFFDHAHLTRLFKKRFGVLPSTISKGCVNIDR